jgi:hypothetical protein
MNKSNHNQFKRAVCDAINTGLTDARNVTGLSVIEEPQSTTIIEDPVDKKKYIQILPNRRQEHSDKVQLKTFPGYRLIDQDIDDKALVKTFSNSSFINRDIDKAHPKIFYDSGFVNRNIDDYAQVNTYYDSRFVNQNINDYAQVNTYYDPRFIDGNIDANVFYDSKFLNRNIYNNPQVTTLAGSRLLDRNIYNNPQAKTFSGSRLMDRNIYNNPLVRPVSGARLTDGNIYNNPLVRPVSGARLTDGNIYNNPRVRPVSGARLVGENPCNNPLLKTPISSRLVGENPCNNPLLKTPISSRLVGENPCNNPLLKTPISSRLVGENPCNNPLLNPYDNPYDNPCNNPCNNPYDNPCNNPCNNPCDKPSTSANRNIDDGLLTSNQVIPATRPTRVLDDCCLISANLNSDVTEFLSLINDVGSRIAYYLDETNVTNFVSTCNIVGDKINIDSIASNIIRGIDDLKAFFFEFGKKIAPHGVNPYCNNDCMQCKKKTESLSRRDNIIDYAKGPYNPNDLNTYMNCLEAATRFSTVRDCEDYRNNRNYNDFNLKVFQSIITSVKTTKFADNEIDPLNVNRPQPFYNPLHLMIEILKIDTKLFNILYLLNLHNSFKSPITDVYYGKARTTINGNGYPVLSNTVTSTDIYNATIQTIDFISCILKLITFIDIDAYNKIIEDHFSILSINNIESAAGETIIIGDIDSSRQEPTACKKQDNTQKRENIPNFLYGQLLSFCDAARQVIPLIHLKCFPDCPLYDPTKVANISYNCTYGMLAISQMMELLLKSRCFATIMSMLFPSVVCHGTLECEESENNDQMSDRNSDHLLKTRDSGPRFQYGRFNHKDMQSLTRLAVDGIPLDMTKIVPPKTIPHYLPEDSGLSINKAVFCTIITALCGISRFLWNSNAPCLRLCDLDDDTCETTCDNSYSCEPLSPLPRECITTAPATTKHPDDDCGIDVCGIDDCGININTFKFDQNINSSNRAVREDFREKIQKMHTNKNMNRNKMTTRAPRDHHVDNCSASDDLFSIEPMIQFLEANTYASVKTCNGKILSYLQVYVSAFADYERTLFNTRATASWKIVTPKPPANRDLYKMLTRGLQLN